MRLLPWVGLAALLLPLVGASAPRHFAPGLGQEAAPAEESAVDKYLRVAREGSPVVRPQAAGRLVGLGAEASARILELAPDPPSLARLGQDVVEILGELPGDELRARLWTALDDTEFPWRPSAARTLAKTARAEEEVRFTALLSDHVSAVRAAAVGAFDRIEGAPASRAAVEALLRDPHDRVRRAAASRLVDWGDACALRWLLADLQRVDRFFDVETGTTARFEAIRLLEKHLGERFGFLPEVPPTDPRNVEAIEAIRAVLGERCSEPGDDLPAIARPGPEDVGREVLGIELRSCRRGEFFLRWTAQDELLVGTGNPARLPLPEGSVARLLQAGAEHVAGLGGATHWGDAGCDAEVFYWRPSGQGRPTVLRLSKGPEAVEGLRPAPLGALATALLETLPDAEAGRDPRLVELRSQVRAGLAAVGGEL